MTLKTWNHCICLLRHSFSFAAVPTLSVGVYTHPCTLASNKLVIFSLNTCSAANIIIFLLKVWIILQLFRGLEKERERKQEKRWQAYKEYKSCVQQALISLTTCPKNSFPCFKLCALAVKNWNWIVLKIKMFQLEFPLQMAFIITSLLLFLIL